MNDETIWSFLNLEELFKKEDENVRNLYVPNAEHTNSISRKFLTLDEENARSLEIEKHLDSISWNKEIGQYNIDLIFNS